MPEKHLAEKVKCGMDPWYFFTRYCYIQSKARAGSVGQPVRFEPWPHLESLLRTVQTKDRIIILKSRQVGITWFFACLALHYALFWPDSNIVVFSRRGQESIKFKLRCRYIYDRLPAFLKVPITTDNEDLLVFGAVRSEIYSLPTTPGSGRSETATLVILDEWAYQEYARENFTAILPAVEFGKLVGISTANGTGGLDNDGTSYRNLFADVWYKAKRGANNFMPIFYPWTVRPERTQAYVDQQARDLPTHMVSQEYPAHEDEAFIAASACMFDVNRLRAMPTREGLPYGLGEIWTPPVPGATYFAGLDPAYAGKGGDFTVLQILDAQGFQVAKLRTQQPIEDFCDSAYNLLAHFYFPRLAVEVQAQGLLVLHLLQATAYRDKTPRTAYPLGRIYHRTKTQVGWYTTAANRETMLSDLSVAIRTGALVIHSPMTISECLSFGRNQEANRFEALTGHDDEVMSLALAHQMRRSMPVFVDKDAKPYVSFGALYDPADDVSWEDPQMRSPEEYHKALADERKRTWIEKT